MKNISNLTLAAFVVVSFALVPGATKGCAQDDVQVAKKLAELDRQWLTSARLRDAETLERLFADGFTEVHAGGGTVDKAGQTAQIKASNTKIDEIHPDQIVVRHLSADVAIRVDTTTIKGASEGKDISGTYRVLRVFINKQGTWQAAGAGLTRLRSGQSSSH